MQGACILWDAAIPVAIFGMALNASTGPFPIHSLKKEINWQLGHIHTYNTTQNGTFLNLGHNFFHFGLYRVQDLHVIVCNRKSWQYNYNCKTKETKQQQQKPTNQPNNQKKK